jgi:hypothetical protein
LSGAQRLHPGRDHDISGVESVSYGNGRWIEARHLDIPYLDG